MDDTTPKETVVMQLILTEDGKLKVTGSVIGDKTACYGLLALAQDAIRELHASKIVKVGGMMNMLRNGK